MSILGPMPMFRPVIWMGDRGIIAGGKLSNNTNINIIEYVTISSLGNGTDFGDMNTTARLPAGGSSNGGNNRGVYNPGYTTTVTNIIEYITISTTGNGTDFGDLTVAGYSGVCTSNGTNERGVWGAGANRSTTIDYVTINSTGNAADFGDPLNGYANGASSSNQTNERGMFACSIDEPCPIDYITINSTGNATDWGDAYGGLYRTLAGSSNGTNERACWAGGFRTKVDITYTTINSLGSAGDMGDLTAGRQYGSGLSNMRNERGLHLGGSSANDQNTVQKNIDYWAINTTSNAADFGDLTSNRACMAAFSNA